MIAELLAKLAGGGVQPEGQKNSGGAGAIVDMIGNSIKQGQDNTAGKAATEEAMKASMQSGTAPMMDKGFYGHMTVNSANKYVPITGAGDSFKSITKEDKAFARSSNLSGGVRSKKAK